MGSGWVFPPQRYQDLRKYFNKINTFCIFRFSQFSVSDQDSQPGYHHLQNSSHQGNLSGVEPEPAKGVVVEDVDDVGDQDQGHSGAESFPGHRAWDFFHAASHLSFDKQLSRADAIFSKRKQKEYGGNLSSSKRKYRHVIDVILSTLSLVINKGVLELIIHWTIQVWKAGY